MPHLQVFPLNINKAGLFSLRQILNVGTVTAVNRYSPSLGYETDNIVSRHGIAALGKFDHQIVGAFDDDSRIVFVAAGPLLFFLFRCFYIFKNCFIGLCLCFFILVVI